MSDQPAPTAVAGEDPTESAPNAMSSFDYDQATSPRAELARARGLSAPYIRGGTDPDAAATAERERPYVRMLIAMVVIIVGSAFLVSIAGLILTGQLQ